MSTEFKDFIGTLKYCQYIRRTEEFRGQKAWKATLELDEKSLEVFKELQSRGCALKLRGENQVQFKCPTSKMISGELINFEPPKVQKYDEGSSSYVDFPDSIGDGTVAKVNVEFYSYANDFGSGIGHRLRGITVINHVPYERQDGTVGQPEEPNETQKSPQSPW